MAGFYPIICTRPKPTHRSEKHALERCAELPGVNLATICEAAANVEPYLRADGTRIWSLMQLERQLRPEAYGRRRGGYLDRRRTPGSPSSLAAGTCSSVASFAHVCCYEAS
jgi:hypothetical protein